MKFKIKALNARETIISMTLYYFLAGGLLSLKLDMINTFFGSHLVRPGYFVGLAAVYLFLLLPAVYIAGNYEKMVTIEGGKVKVTRKLLWNVKEILTIDMNSIDHLKIKINSDAPKAKDDGESEIEGLYSLIDNKGQEVFKISPNYKSDEDKSLIDYLINDLKIKVDKDTEALKWVGKFNRFHKIFDRVSLIIAIALFGGITIYMIWQYFFAHGK